MNHESQPAVIRVPRRARLAIGAFATVVSLTGAAGWAVGASADVGSVDEAGGAGQVLCTPNACVPTSSAPSVPPTSPPTSPGTTSAQAAFTWTFDDGTPGGWYGYPTGGSVLAPWLTPSSGAAASGRGGLLVGGVAGTAAGAAVDIARTMVAPGTYAVTARVRLAPGQPATSFELTGPAKPFGTTVTDGAWVTLTGSVIVPATGTARLVIAPGYGYCPAPNRGDYAPATSFHLDEVTLTRSGDSSASPVPTTRTPSDCPTYTAAPPATAKIHYEVTSSDPSGFSATLVLTNLRDTPITGWAVPMNTLEGNRRISWVAGGGAVTTSTSTSSQTKLVGGAIAPDIPARGQVRISVGLSGSPVGSANLFTRIEGQQTGRN